MSLHDPGADLLVLRKLFHLDIQSYSEIEVEDILERARLGDIEGVAITANIGVKRAKQLAMYLSELESKARIRSVLRTPDSRRLRNDLLTLISLEASSEMSKNRILLQTPTLDRGLILDRLRLCKEGLRIFTDLAEQGRLDWIKNELTSISLKLLTPKDRKIWNESETITYFVSRMPCIDVLYNIHRECSDIPSLMSLFHSVDFKVLEKIREAVDEVSTLDLQDPEAIISDAEITINEQVRQSEIDEESVRRIVEDAVVNTANSLRMDENEEERLKNAAFQRLSLPFEFDRVEMSTLISDWINRQSQDKVKVISQIEETLKGLRDTLKDSLDQLVTLDQLLAISTVSQIYTLTIPDINEGGIGFIEGHNLLLGKEFKDYPEKSVQTVNYSVGTPSSTGITPPRNTVLLTGANSGGKTTLLITMAEIHILTLLGIPVPAKKAEVIPIPIYLFKRRTTRKIGSLEHALSSLIPVFTKRERKLILIDEIEALTEPGAAGRIIATLLTKSASGGSFLLLVTHLARETLPHVKLPIRVDGIEARGLNYHGDLDVDRQPKFNHVGSSTPKLILMKLARETKHEKTKALYNEVLVSLDTQRDLSVQTPLNLPWLHKIGSQK